MTGLESQTEVRLAKLEDIVAVSTPGEPKGPSADLLEELKGLRKEVEDLRKGGAVLTEGDDDRQRTSLVNGLGSFWNVEDAGKWFIEQMWWLHAPGAVETYSKGEFRGLLFVRYHSKKDRDLALKLLRQSSIKSSGDQV